MYYATYNCYGVGTISAATGLPFGIAYAFDTKQERDSWLSEAEDYYDGNAHTETITSKEARRMMVRELRSDYDVYVGSWLTMRELVDSVEYERSRGCYYVR